MGVGGGYWCHLSNLEVWSIHKPLRVQNMIVLRSGSIICRRAAGVVEYCSRQHMAMSANCLTDGELRLTSAKIF